MHNMVGVVQVNRTPLLQVAVRFERDGFAFTFLDWLVREYAASSVWLRICDDLYATLRQLHQFGWSSRWEISVLLACSSFNLHQQPTKLTGATIIRNPHRTSVAQFQLKSNSREFQKVTQTSMKMKSQSISILVCAIDLERSVSCSARVQGNACRLISFCKSFFLLQAAVPHNNYKAAFIF